MGNAYFATVTDHAVSIWSLAEQRANGPASMAAQLQAVLKGSCISDVLWLPDFAAPALATCTTDGCVRTVVWIENSQAAAVRFNEACRSIFLQQARALMLT